MYYNKIQTPLGDFFCIIKNNAIISFSPYSIPNLPQHSSPLIQECQNQIEAYFAHLLTHFTLPIALQGSDFSQSIYNALRKIPYKSTISYQELATLAGYPKASRAVGNALKNNPLLLLIPCHRAIKSNGEIGGFALGREAKKKLLEIEGIFLPT